MNGPPRWNTNSKGLSLSARIDIGIAAVLVICLALYAAYMLTYFRVPVSPFKEAAITAERHAVQTAMQEMMADREIFSVDAHSGRAHRPTNNWMGLPTGPGALPLSDYLHSGTTVFYYCWDSSGSISGSYRDDGSTCARDPDWEN